MSGNNEKNLTFEDRVESLIGAIEAANHQLEALKNQLMGLKEEFTRMKRGAEELNDDNEISFGAKIKKKKTSDDDDEEAMCPRHNTLDPETGNFRCTHCFADLGANGRQLCGKTRCLTPSRCCLCGLPLPEFF